MKEKLKGLWLKIKKFWLSLSHKVRIIAIVAVSVVLVAAVGLTIFLNANKSDGYIVLFPEMESSEATEVYNVLQSKGVSTKINSKGEIEVPQEQWDSLVFELAQLGYPQSTPSYGTFFDNLTMTMTDFEKKQTLRFELQDRLQETIKRIEGVSGVIVTISMPDDDNYAWQENTEKATASVTLTLGDNVNFTPENVSAIKNLVAYSAQQMEPTDVKVINAKTGVELLGAEEIENEDTSAADQEKRLYYQNIMQQQMEQNAEKILVPIYGNENVTAVATVSLDYDKISQEIKELITNDDGEGVKTNEDVSYKTPEYTVDEDGVVGEDPNTDQPTETDADGNIINYAQDNESVLNSDNTVEYQRSTEWAIGYILTQKDVAQGVIKDASISVVVKDENVMLTDTEKNALTELVKNATNIDMEKISVYSKYIQSEVTPSEQTSSGVTLRQYVVKVLPWLIGLLLLIILLIVVLSILVNRHTKHKIKMAAIANEQKMRSLQQELNEQKKPLKEEVQESNNKQNATANEVRDFVRDNPAITAALIRSMLKEDK